MNNNEYQKIEFMVGSSIETAFKKLQDYAHKYNCRVCGEFNKHMLYSDIDSLDSAYKKITDMSYTEFKQKEKQRQEEYEQHKKDHKKAIPELTKEWIAKGKEVLHKDKWQEWEYIVPIRLRDLYEGLKLL